MTKALPFERIRSARISDAAVEQIMGLIASGHIEVGDQLPSERELIKRLGVSRTSIREALRILEAQGVLEVQPGRGAFVISTGNETDFLSPITNWLYVHKRDMLDIVEVREAIESKAVFLAAKNISPNQLEQMEVMVEQMVQYTAMGQVDELTATDRAFHRLFCEASGNNFLKTLADNIVEALAEPRYSILAVPRRATISLQEHRRILNALKARDPEAARKALVAHLQSVARAISSLPDEETLGVAHDGV